MNEKTKHTPGPWKVDPCVDADGHETVRRDDGGNMMEQPIATAYYPGDARLIASAPELLRSLQRLTHPMADDDDVDNARAVIAKATGDSE